MLRASLQVVTGLTASFRHQADFYLLLLTGAGSSHQLASGYLPGLPSSLFLVTLGRNILCILRNQDPPRSPFTLVTRPKAQVLSRVYRPHNFSYREREEKVSFLPQEMPQPSLLKVFPRLPPEANPNPEPWGSGSLAGVLNFLAPLSLCYTGFGNAAFSINCTLPSFQWPSSPCVVPWKASWVSEQSRSSKRILPHARPVVG